MQHRNSSGNKMLYCAYTLAAGLLLRTHPGSRTFVAHTPCMAAGNAPWQQDFYYAHILAAGLYCTYTMAARLCCTGAIFIFIFYVLVCLSGGVAEKRRKIKLSCCTSAGLQVIPSELQSSDILNSCLGRGTKE